MKNEHEVQAKVLELVRQEIHPSIEPETMLIEEGLLDSFHTLKLVTKLERLFDVRLEVGEIKTEDVESVQAIARLITELQQK